MEREIDDIAEAIRNALIARLGEAWMGTLSAADRATVSACCIDAAELQVRALAIGNEPAARASLLADRAHITAQLANITVIGAGELEARFWSIVRRLATEALAVVLVA